MIGPSLRAVAVLSPLCLFLAACPGEPDQPPVPDPAPEVLPHAIVVNDPLLLMRDFSFGKTIGSILKSSAAAPEPSQGEKEALVQTLIDGFSVVSRTHPVAGVSVPLEVRGIAERTLKPADLLGEDNEKALRPIALFNRIDLTREDQAHCGEYRIVYSLRDQFFLIFEAILPRPEEASCRDVALLWAKAAHLDGGAAMGPLGLAELSKFFFEGAAGFDRVVSAENYGLGGPGQVRSNSVLGGAWQLRQWSVDASTGTKTFALEPVNDAPIAEYFPDRASGEFEQERMAFQEDFHARSVDRLFSADIEIDANADPQTFREELFGRMSAEFAPRFDDFQSDSAGTDDYKVRAGQAFTEALTPRQTADGARSASPQQFLARADAMRCGGCHHTTPGASVGDASGSVQWPGVLGFFHVSSAPQLSPFVADFMIPFRKRRMEEILNGQGGEKKLIAATLDKREVALGLAEDLLSNAKASAESDLVSRYQQAKRAAIVDEAEAEGLVVKHRRPH